MAEYIEREETLEDLRLQFCKGCNSYSEIKCRSCSVDDVIGFIEDVPTADVVPVVRCGECEHFKEYPIIDTSIPSGWGKCTKINMDVDLTINDYCSYGERRCSDG